MSPPTANVPVQAGGGSFTLTAGAYCWWGYDQSNSPWFTITSAVYNGTGTVTTFSYSVTANPGDQRTATITFLVPISATFTITQDAGVPPLTITSPTSLSPGAAGSAYAGVTFMASGGTGGYTWSAAGLPNGLSIDPVSGALSGTPAANSKGSYNPQFTVEDSSSLTASVDLTLTINNPTPAPILTSLLPASATPGGPAFTLTVNGSGFVSGASVQWNGSGLSTTFVNAGQLTALVPATLIAASATAAVTVLSGGMTSNSVSFAIAAGCSSAVPSAFTFSSGGGSGTVRFNTLCQWAVTGNPSWVNLAASSGASLSFSFSVAPNPPPAATRQATLSINGGPLTVAITQSGLVCTYTISDSATGFGVSRSFSSSGGSGGINVVAPPGCTWTATPSQSFITVSGSPSGDGNGGITYSVAPNTGQAPQAGTITIAGLAYVINQQPPGSQANSCSASSSASLIRPEGYSEKLGDIVLQCSGQALPGGLVGDVLVSFNTGITTNINVANLLLSSGHTDALLLEDEPTASNLALGTNTFRGVLSSMNGTEAILFPAVQLADVSGGAFTHIWRIANARAGGQGLGSGSTVQATVSITATEPFAVSGQPTVATVAQASRFSVPASSLVSGQTIQPVSFTEGFATAFVPRLATGQDPSQVGAVYNSESGYVDTAKLGAQTGFGTSGTRLIVAIANVPAGVSVAAPVAPASGTNAVLVSADATGAGGSPVSVGSGYQQIILTAGAGTATWEVTASDSTKIDTLTFNLVLMNPNNVSLGGITFAGALAPVSSGPAPQLPSTKLPAPRFASSTVAAMPPDTVTLSLAPQGQSPSAALKPSLRSEAASSSAVGGTVTWTQIQANSGAPTASTAPNVSVLGTLPPTWVITNCTPVDSGGVCPTLDPNNPSNSYTVTYPSLSPGETGTIQLTAQSGSQAAGTVEYTSGIDSDLVNTNPSTGSFTVNFPVSQIGLNVSSTHSANFSQGQLAAQYSVTVANGGSLPTSLPVTVSEMLPASLKLVSMMGSGWTCPPGASSCTRSDILAANSSYPAITVTVNVASNAPSTATNQVIATTGVLQATGSDVTNITAVSGTPPAFFNGEVTLGSGVYYLQFPGGSAFGYYNLQSFPIFFHYDMGFEAFVDGGSGSTYLYDFTTGHWWYTSPSLFPYLYDFTLNTFIYYFPDTKNPGHYTTNPRYFSNLTTGKIFTM